MTTKFRERVSNLIGTVVAVYAFICLCYSAIPGLRHGLRGIRHLLANFIFPMPETSITWSFALAILAGALLARKRLAWWILATVLFVFVSLSYFGLWVLVSGEFESLLIVVDSENTWAVVYILVGFQTVLLLLTLAAYPAFPAKTQHASIRKALGAYLLGEGIVTLLAWGLVACFPGHDSRFGSLNSADWLPWAASKAYMFGWSWGKWNGLPPFWVQFVVSVAAAVAFIWAVYVLFRAQKDSNSLSQDDETAIRAMIARFGQDDSLAYFATRRDKAAIYSPDGRAAITYRTELGVSVASGDPVGDPAAWEKAIRAWLAQARRYGWTPAVMGASERGARAYAHCGLQTIHLGDEAVLYADSLNLRQPEFKAVRQAVARARRAGVSVRIRRHGELTAPEMDAVQHDADAWRDTTDERGFSMALGRLGDPDDTNCLLVEAVQDAEHSPTGIARRVGLLSFSPWGNTGMSLDLMRRAHDAPNGTVELMVATLCEDGPDVGVTRISLNFAVFRKVFASAGAVSSSPVARVWHGLLVFLSRFWQMEALYRSNEKYNPTWVPRYLCYMQNRSLARIGLVAGIVEGFVNVPWGDNFSSRKATGSVRHEGLDEALTLVPLWLDEAAAGRCIRHHRPEQVEVRLAKARRLMADGVDPWPTAVAPSHHCADIAALVDTPTYTPITLSGRILARRDFGGVMFLSIQDWSGRTQVILERSRTADHEVWRSRLDLGDIVFVRGLPGRSRTGEPSLLAEDIHLEAKSLQPLPNKATGLADPEARVRLRHVDLAVNCEPRRALCARSAVLHAFREQLHSEGYMEVETPILQTIHGGANARPFTTHINAYNMDLYLRIAPELFLKRLLCGGVEKVFELGRNFRNEGVDATHNPEFTALEAYCAHGDYNTMRELAQRLIVAAATAVHGRPVVLDPDGREVDIAQPWPVVSVFRAISDGARADGVWNGPDITIDTPRRELRALAERAGLAVRPDADEGALIEELYEEFAESRTTTPTFYVDFPVSVSPLTRRHRRIPGLTERWDLVAWGVELGCAYSELTNPIDQRERLEAQSLLAAGGDVEAMEVDEEFLRALEFGMPPTGGLGIGVDRIVMLITGLTIRQSLPFPLVARRGGN